ncbi:small, acid-soluble spore protein, alpha/beta type [Tumebacillus lipolyticus]|uniref:Small, acid-soluble spore protein, alpha/beta type n=1 Tax=Tumebacillus lipolyticus TaxID=1280370 RepID=A0ABW4ZWB4_9BACL
MNKKRAWDINDPEVRLMVERMKHELADELGIRVPLDGYWGNHASKELGQIGSQLKRRVPVLLKKTTDEQKKRN